MGINTSRRGFIKLGVIAGITVMIGKLPVANALQVNSGQSSSDWIDKNGKAKFRWDAIRKVTGHKNFARDYRAKNIPDWPDQQSYAFMLKVTHADRTFEGVDLSILGDHLQPDVLILQEDLVRDGLNVPQDAMGHGFYGENILLPKGTTSPILGHPVAILVYNDFPRFNTAKRMLQFNTDVVKYGEITGIKPPKNYGVARYVRIGGATPYDPSVFSPYIDAGIKGAFDGNTVVWPPFAPHHKPSHIPPVIRKDRAGSFVAALRQADQKPDTQTIAMEHVADLVKAIENAKNDPEKFVLERKGFSQSIDPVALEPDNSNTWYDAATKTLHIMTATQSPAGVVEMAADLAKNNKHFPVETIILLTGSTVGYGSKDYSVFPIYSMAASFYSQYPVRMANDRYEQFQMGMKRHSIEMDVTIVGDRKTGKFEVLKGTYNCNGGGRENLSVAVSHVAVRGAQSIYYFPNSDLTAIAMATPAVEAGSMRGFGSLQSMAITELMVDEIASELKIDPVELRRRNAILDGYPNTQGGIIAGDPRNVEMLDLAAKHPLWVNREQAKKDYEAKNPGRLYGVGFSQVQQVYGSSGVPTILSLSFDADGKLTMRHCVQEIGTGGTTAQQVMIWQALGKVPDIVEFGVTEFDELPLTTDYKSKDTPYWTPGLIPDMSSSSGVYYIGFGTRQAGKFLLENTLWPAAKAIWSEGVGGGSMGSYDVQFSDIRVGPEGIGGGGMKPIPFDVLAKKAHELGLITGVAVHAYSTWHWARADFDIPTVGNVNLPLDAISVQYGDGAPKHLREQMTTAGFHFIKRKKVYYAADNRSGADPTTVTPAACLVELNVNTFTGDVEVMSHHMIMDPGTMIVPELVSGQIQGGTAMGLGHALMEELPLYEDGPGNGTWNFNRYIVPRAKDVAVWNQSIDYLPPLSETSPPKGMAELGMVPILPATGNALTHATGKRFYEFPITPDKIKKALA